MSLACFSVGPAEPVDGPNKNYESEGRTFESFRARHFLPLHCFCKDFPIPKHLISNAIYNAGFNASAR